MLSASVFVHAQTVHKTEHGIVTHIQGQRIELTFYDDAIVRITKTENREYELSPVPVVTVATDCCGTMLPQQYGRTAAMRRASSRIWVLPSIIMSLPEEMPTRFSLVCAASPVMHL